MTDYLDLLLKILTMAGVTYLIRMIPLTFFEKKITSPFFLSFLYYVPYAVLSAMTFPAIMHATGHLVSGILGMLCGAVLALRGKSLLTVAIATCVGSLLGELLILALPVLAF